MLREHQTNTKLLRNFYFQLKKEKYIEEDEVSGSKN